MLNPNYLPPDPFTETSRSPSGLLREPLGELSELSESEPYPQHDESRISGQSPGLRQGARLRMGRTDTRPQSGARGQGLTSRLQDLLCPESLMPGYSPSTR